MASQEPEMSQPPPLAPDMNIGGIPKYWYWINFILLVVVILLQIGSLSTENWAKWGHDNEFEMGLVRCSSCPEGMENWSWLCLDDEYCSAQSDSGLCNVAKQGYDAGTAYIVLEIFSIICTLMLAERILAYLADRDYGNPYLVYGIAGAGWFFHFLATVVWFGVLEATFDASCDEDATIRDDDYPEICATTGADIAVANIIIMFACIVLFIVIWCKRNDNMDAGKHGIETGQFCCLSTRKWIAIIIGLLIFNLVFLIGGWMTEKWVKGGGENSFSGSLWYCIDWYTIKNIKHEGWDCWAGITCETFDTVSFSDFDLNQLKDWDDRDPEDSGLCEMYRGLSRSGRFFSFLQVALFIVIILWAQNLIYAIFGRDFGIPCLNYFYPIAIFIFQFLATIAWFGRSQAKFDGSCDDNVNDLDWDEKPEVWATDGPAIAVFEIFNLLILVILYIIVYCKRGQEPDDELAQFDGAGASEMMQQPGQPGQPFRQAPPTFAPMSDQARGFEENRD